MSNKIDPDLESKIRFGFKFFNKFMVFLWRLGMGPWFGLWPQGWGQIMVITHTGRKTGEKYKTPVNFTILEGEIFCIAGFGKIADWYRNLITTPEAEIWLPGGWWKVIAEDVSDVNNRTEIMRSVVKASGFAGPMFGVDQKKLDDNGLAKATRSYKILHLQRVSALTGGGGPGDLALIWQIVTFLLIPLLFINRNKRRKT